MAGARILTATFALLCFAGVAQPFLLQGTYKPGNAHVRTTQLLNQLCHESQMKNALNRDACYGCFYRASSQPSGYPVLLSMSACSDSYLNNTDYGHCQAYLKNSTTSLDMRVSPTTIHCTFLECVRQVNKDKLSTLVTEIRYMRQNENTVTLGAFHAHLRKMQSTYMVKFRVSNAMQEICPSNAPIQVFVRPSPPIFRNVRPMPPMIRRDPQMVPSPMPAGMIIPHHNQMHHHHRHHHHGHHHHGHHHHGHHHHHHGHHHHHHGHHHHGHHHHGHHHHGHHHHHHGHHHHGHHHHGHHHHGHHHHEHNGHHEHQVHHEYHGYQHHGNHGLHAHYGLRAHHGNHANYGHHAHHGLRIQRNHGIHIKPLRHGYQQRTNNNFKQLVASLCTLSCKI